MTYQEAADKLAAFLEAMYDQLDDDWYMVLDTAYDSLIHCVAQGLHTPIALEE